MTEDGFEYQGTFYRWSVSDIGKDLMLIDRFSGMSLPEFYELVDDGFDRGRAPLLLTLIATSIRNGHPDWTVERITRTVMDLSLGDVGFVEGDEGEPALPPPGPAEEPTGGNSASSSRPASSAPEPATSATSNATPA